MFATSHTTTAKVEETYTAEICVAGDLQDAIRLCRTFCMQQGLCVTVTPTTFVYTGGAETGVLVRLVNYPRFPRQKNEIWETAKDLAQHLRAGLAQHSCLIIDPDLSLWLSERDA